MTKKIKKTTAFLSAVVMVMAMLMYFPSGTFSNIDWGLKASAAEITPSQPEGDGTSNDPYKIGTAGELYWFAGLVNGTLDGSTQNQSAYAVLTADIKVNSNVLDSDGNPNNSGFTSWTPIGNSSKKYTGTFDGQGHKISGLYFNDTNEKTGLYVGLFGYVGINGSVSNVGVVDSYFKGNSYVGGVCGWNYGYGGTATITNCYNSGTVEGTTYVGGVCGNNYAGSGGTATITNCYNTGSVNGSGDYVGGVCGANYAKDGTATITNCYNTGTVTATAENEKVDANAGGVCGYNYAESGGTATITNCYNTGTVSGESKVGGVCGQNSASDNGKATITNCYNTGTVSGESRVGGVCGYNCATSETATATITNCYNTGAVSGTGLYVGGVCGFNYAGSGGTATITNCYYLVGKATGGINGSDVPDSAESRTTEQFESGEVCGLVGYHSQFENGFCGLCSNGYQPATLTDGVYAIGNAGQLYWFAGLVNGTLDGVAKDASANAVFTVDIIVNTGNVAGCNGTNTEGWRDWTPIGNNSNRYTGTFDGQNHKISGLYFNNPGTSCVGLFGCVGSGGSVSNVGVVDSNFKGKDRVGGVCGFNIIDSNGTATATITNCYNTGNVTGESNVGGVCGESRAFYNKCTATITNCYNTGAVSGNDKVGGVCGFNFAQYGTATITNCYNTGSVSGSENVGGVCGGNHAALSGAKVTITNCYNTGAVSGNDKVGGVCEFNIVNGETATATITDCYYLATGETDSIDGTTFKTSEQFNSGEVCYLLNGKKSDDTVVWYQTIDSGIKDVYPLLDGTHGKVYASEPCPSEFSNTDNLPEKEHSCVVDTENGKTHKCTKCGETHNAKFTADNENKTISICCDPGKVTLKAPTQLTYDGKEKKATVEGNIDGFDTPDIVYDNDSTIAPKNAGEHTASITYTIGGTNHSVSVEYTIGKATPVGAQIRNINVVRGVGEFTEPNFTDVDGKPLEGYVKYDGKIYQQLVEELKTSLLTDEVVYKYEFTPNDRNYNKVTGEILFIFRDVEFKVGNDKATDENAVTIKENPTYGDTWEEILKLNEGLKAVISGTAVTGGFSFDVTGSPNAGSHTYKVLFTGDIGGNHYENLAVVSGTVDVAPKLLTVSAGTYKVSKEYNETIAAGIGSGEFKVEGLVEGDSVTINADSIGKYSAPDVGNYEVMVHITLSGDKANNYNFTVSSIKVPAEITKATPSAPSAPTVSASDCHSVTLTPNAAYQFSMDGENWQDSNVFTGLTAGTKYTFYQRIKATANYEASANSTEVLQTTAEHDYSAENAKPEALYKKATCTSPAVYYYSCSICGDVEGDSTHTFTNGSTLEHNDTDNDNRCDTCGHIMDGIGAKLAGYSLSLSGNIGVNFYMELSDEVVADETAYMQFTLPNGEKPQVKVSEAEKVTLDNKEYYVFTCEVAAKEMDNTITAQIITSDGEGVAYKYTVRDYADYILDEANGYDDNTKAVVSAMLSYGDYAKAYFSGEELTATSEINAVTSDMLAGYAMTESGILPEGIEYYGSTLLLESETTIRHYFKVTEGTDISAYNMTEKGGYYYIQCSDIPAGSLGTAQDISVGEYTISYSPLSYAKAVLESENPDANLKNLVKALYIYNQNAIAYNAA